MQLFRGPPPGGGQDLFDYEAASMKYVNYVRIMQY